MVLYSNNLKWIKPVIIIIFILAFVVFVLISPFVMFSIENQLLADELNNPYINANFSGWKSLNINNFGDIMVPDNWIISQNADESYYYVENHTTGNIMASAIVLNESESFYDFLESYAEVESVEISTEYDTNYVSIEGSGFYKCTLIKDADQDIYYCFYMNGTDNNTKLYFAFPSDNGLEYNELIEITEAISYSYIYV